MSDILACLQEIFQFNRLMKNDFLLRKFNKQTAYVGVYWLARENTLRPFVQYGEDFDLIYLNDILSEYNNVYWEYDMEYGLVKPIFERRRIQIQCLVSMRDQQMFYQTMENHLEENQEIKIEICEQQYQGNLNYVKVFLVFENEEVTQGEFKWMMEKKSELGFESIRMEEYDYMSEFVSQVEQSQNKYKVKQLQKQLEMELMPLGGNRERQVQKKQRPQQQEKRRERERGEKENVRGWVPRNDIEEWFGKAYR